MTTYYKTLKEMTGKPEGYLLYPDGKVFWLDWSHYDGIPGKTVQPFEGDTKPEDMQGVELIDLLQGRRLNVPSGKPVMVGMFDNLKRWMVLPYTLHDFDLPEDHMVEVFVIE